jgi:DNA-binding response OmpR family regulator
MKERILVAEDDRAILTGVADLLESEGYEVIPAVNGAEALELYRQRSPDLVLLDVMMPEMSGYDVCRAIRGENPVVPVVMLTAKGQEVDRVVGLELGADDYIVKPFGMAELLARVRAALRRGALAAGAKESGEESSLAFGNVRVDFDAMAGSRGGSPFTLTPRENALECDVTTRTVDQHVVRLRQKIEDDPSKPVHLLTVHGAGYRFRKE